MSYGALIYWTIGKGVIATATRLLVDLKGYGIERIPREGGAVLAMNHLSYLDPPAFGTLCPRRIVFVAKIELFENRWLGQLIASHGTISVRRGESDRDALRRMRETVRRNELLGLFVEGTRQRAGEPGRVQAGAAMISIQEGVPIVPAAIYGSNLWRLGKVAPVSIACGEPMRFDELPRNGRGYREASAEIETEIRRLWDFLAAMHALARPDGVPPRRARVPAKTG